MLGYQTPDNTNKPTIPNAPKKKEKNSGLSEVKKVLSFE
jgi:hypothetical protein